MAYLVRAAEMADIPAAVRVEASAVGGNLYLEDASDYFLHRSQGELTLVLSGDEVVGVGKYTLLPDRSGWLETLRVHKDWQRRGVGTEIYRRYLAQAADFGSPAIRMYTGMRNLASRGLAEKFGLSIAGSAIGATLRLAEKPAAPAPDFQPVGPQEAGEILETMRAPMKGFLVLNNTFFAMNPATYRYLAENGMTFRDAAGNFVAVGARMLPERGMHLAAFAGDLRRCLAFAEAHARAAGMPALTVSYPPGWEEVRAGLEAAGYTEDRAPRIVMERVF